MHSRSGALSETLHVYGPLAALIADKKVPPCVLIVGLGLGYVEMCVAGAWLAAGGGEELLLVSYETDARLREGFLDFLRNDLEFIEDTSTSCNSAALPQLHANIMKATAAHFGVSPRALHGFLRALCEKGSFRILEAFGEREAKCVAGAPFGGVFFDAYSASTSADLWTDEILTAVFALAGAQAGFACYASRTSLKRAARAAGFRVVSRAGFAGKRECTLALRGV